MLWPGLSQRRLCRSPGRFSSRVKRAHRLWTRRHRHYTCPFLHSSHSTCQLHLVRRCEECRNLPIRSTKPNPHADGNHNHSCNTPSPFPYFVVFDGHTCTHQNFLQALPFPVGGMSEPGCHDSGGQCGATPV